MPNILILSSILSLLITAYPNALPTDITNGIRTDPDAIRAASNDYGNLVHQVPSAVLYPSSINDIVELIKASCCNYSTPFTIAARGRGHSVRGQAMAGGGVVVEMAALSRNGGGIRVSWSRSLGYYADVGGEEMWADVLRVGLEHGLAPVSWTDYLYLTVGGTLSNAGISGQSFRHGPQISNVLELDVVTGKGELITCSRNMNSELFFGALGGLGQFGIITRARIVLDKAPARARWARLIYSNFSEFTRDQERLILTNASNYVEGFLITNERTTKQWRSSFSSPSHQSDVASLWKKHRLLYSIELVKYYDNLTASTIDKEFGVILEELNFIPGFIFRRDVPLVDFLNRAGNLDDGREELEAHPWLNLFIPKSRIHDFYDGVLENMIPKLRKTPGLFIFYPLNTKKWDSRMSAVTPDEDVFYNLGLLHSGRPNESDVFELFNNQVLGFCEKAGIKVKQYLPYHKSREDWIKHFGSKWSIFQQRKMEFDPKMILSPGQRIFN
ncbi:cytokinin dehydrogenase 4-like [Sesamum indicum]|uniref:cytokinin dehydrogenase n=1 Tax=Sesamum indicum TaxID=4182 RepID=A0A6I9T4Q8_SESIN|nr:cytokinin dehydrogenase 4-like [Sesamum indicum]